MMLGVSPSTCFIRCASPAGAIPRNGNGVERYASGAISGASAMLQGPTPKATRYVGSGSVGANVNVFQPLPAGASATCLVLATPTSLSGMVRLMSNGVLKPGSSKLGKA